jgi:hypothetical protein
VLTPALAIVKLKAQRIPSPIISHGVRKRQRIDMEVLPHKFERDFRPGPIQVG